MNIDDDADLERSLRQALARIEPGRDFSAISYSRPRVIFWPPSRTMLALAAGLVLLFRDAPATVTEADAAATPRAKERAVA